MLCSRAEPQSRFLAFIAQQTQTNLVVGVMQPLATRSQENQASRGTLLHSSHGAFVEEQIPHVLGCSLWQPCILVCPRLKWAQAHGISFGHPDVGGRLRDWYEMASVVNLPGDRSTRVPHTRSPNLI